MADRDDDSDAPEEFTIEQGIKQDEEIRRIQRESKSRVIREGKEQRRRWEERKTKRPPRVKSSVEDPERETHEGGQAKGGLLATNVKEGMLPIAIVNHLAAHEKKTFHSDSEDEALNDNKPVSKKKRQKNSGEGPVLLREIPAAECLRSSMEFLKKRKGHISRSTSVLKNPNQALRLLSTTGVLRQR